MHWRNNDFKFYVCNHVLFFWFFLFFHAKKWMTHLQHLHLCWQLLNNLYPLTSWYLWILMIIYFEKKLGIDPIGFSAPWEVYYFNNCIEPSTFNYQTFSYKTFFTFILHLSHFKKLNNNKPLENIFCLMMIFINQFLLAITNV